MHSVTIKIAEGAIGKQIAPGRVGHGGVMRLQRVFVLLLAVLCFVGGAGRRTRSAIQTATSSPCAVPSVLRI